MNRFFILLIGLLFFACQQKKDKVIDMSDVTPKSEHDYTQNKKEKIDTIDFGFNSIVANKLGFNLSGIKFIEEPMFPDRFSPKRTKKLVLLQEIDSTIFCQWSYKDSIQTKNALYNWIDCYGPKCKSIKYGQKINYQKDNFILLENDTSLTYISSSNKLIVEDWLKYFELTSEIKDWKLVIHQGVRAKATWYKVVDGEKEPISTK